MYRKEVNAQSPLRILAKSIHGGLGTGHLGVVMAPAGVGKTACLVQIGLDDLMRERDVLHVAIGQTVEYVSAWYEALFEDLAQHTKLLDRDAVRASVAKHRVIKTFAEGAFSAQKLDEALEMFGKHMSLQPKAILVDGLGWGAGAHETLAALKQTVARLGAELWITATTPRGYKATASSGVTPPCEDCRDVIDVGLYLESKGDHVEVRLIKDHESPTPPDMILRLHPETLRLVADGEVASTPVRLPASSYTLLSGAANGAEAEFGACAERWGLAEVNYTFPGRGTPARARGLVELNDEELRQGDVSSSYLKAKMHRVYPDTPLFKKVLQSIWHEVNTSGEIFHVGQIEEDGTVRGGTGWAVELGKHWGKLVHVFDQEKHAWYTWRDGAWVQVLNPVITRERFTGTGTRFLTDHGRSAIRALFEKSFGAPKS